MLSAENRLEWSGKGAMVRPLGQGQKAAGVWRGQFRGILNLTPNSYFHLVSPLSLPWHPTSPMHLLRHQGRTRLRGGGKRGFLPSSSPMTPTSLLYPVLDMEWMPIHRDWDLRFQKPTPFLITLSLCLVLVGQDLGNHLLLQGHAYLSAPCFPV